MAGLWEAPSDRNEVYIRGAAVALAAFVLTGFVYLAIQQIAGFASGKAAPKMSRAVGSEYIRNDADTSADAQTVSPMSPGGVPAYRSATYSPPVMPVNAPSFAPPGSPGYTPFAVEAQRKVAQETLKPLRDVLTTVRRYDSQAVWTTLPTASNSATAQGGVLLSHPETRTKDDDSDDERAREDTFAAVAETQRRRQNTERILGETESISTELTLIAHPDRFPEPLRDGVGDVAREMRLYLATVQLAAAHPEDKDRLHTLATQHLSNCEAAQVRLEQMAGGAGLAAN